MEKRSITNLLLGLGIAFMVLGAGAGIALNYKSIASTVNGWMGDAQKVTFTNLDKKADLYSGDSHVVVKDGVFTLANNTAAEIRAYIYSSPKNPGTLFSVYTALTFCALDSLDSAITGSMAEPFKPAAKINVPVTVSGVSKVYFQGNSFCLYGGDSFINGSSAISLLCPAGASAYVKDLMTVDLAPLGYSNDVKAAASVWEKLNKGEYFEGDKTFTKGEIKKAISDYEADQKAASTSAASTASASAAASSKAA